MIILGPIKRKSTGKVLGYFYRSCGNGMLQYISFHSSVESIEANKVEPATQAELDAEHERQRAAGKRG